MKSQGTEILDKIKELRNLSNELNHKLEIDGLSITNIPKEQLFNYNIKSMISAVEALLRNEPSEKSVFRLEKDIPDAFTNIGKLQNTAQGRSNSESLARLKELVEYVEKNYRRL